MKGRTSGLVGKTGLLVSAEEGGTGEVAGRIGAKRRLGTRWPDVYCT
jgi:hypothetical protein